MQTVQKNQSNLAHVFQLVRPADGVILQFVRVDQACPRRLASRNREQVKRYLDSRVGEGLSHQHLHTGTLDEAEELMRTLNASYPGLE